MMPGEARYRALAEAILRSDAWRASRGRVGASSAG
jgi:hypothetical protein